MKILETRNDHIKVFDREKIYAPDKYYRRNCPKCHSTLEFQRGDLRFENITRYYRGNHSWQRLVKVPVYGSFDIPYGYSPSSDSNGNAQYEYDLYLLCPHCGEHFFEEKGYVCQNHIPTKDEAMEKLFLYSDPFEAFRVLSQDEIKQKRKEEKRLNRIQRRNRRRGQDDYDDPDYDSGDFCDDDDDGIDVYVFVDCDDDDDDDEGDYD